MRQSAADSRSFSIYQRFVRRFAAPARRIAGDFVLSRGYSGRNPGEHSRNLNRTANGAIPNFEKNYPCRRNFFGEISKYRI